MQAQLLNRVAPYAAAEGYQGNIVGEISANIEAAMEKIGIEIDEMARRTGLERATVERHISGTVSNFTEFRLRQFAEAFGISDTKLFVQGFDSEKARDQFWLKQFKGTRKRK